MSKPKAQALNKDTEQYILNKSYDSDYEILATEMVGYDGTNLQRVRVGADGSMSPDYTLRLDETTTTNVVYIGKAVIGSSESDPVWQIRKLDTSVISMLYADGDASFDNIWDNRATTVNYS